MKMTNKVYDILKWIAQYFFRLLAHCTSPWLAFGDCPTESRS